MTAAAAAVVAAVVIAIVAVACSGPSSGPKSAPGGHSTASASGGHTRSGSPSPSPSHSAHHSARPHQRTGQSPGKTVATFSGRGTAKTRHFLIMGTGDWTLVWSYHCQAPGGFAVSEDGGTDINGVQVSQHGSGGHGQTKVFGDTGHHYLTVTSACAWKLTVAVK